MTLLVPAPGVGPSSGSPRAEMRGGMPSVESEAQRLQGVLEMYTKRPLCGPPRFQPYAALEIAFGGETSKTTRSM